ncbi:MAG: hypothetical protein ABIG44_17130 [Planctomycetota bacterium]
MAEPSRELIDAIYADKVRQARRMSIAERLKAGGDMFDEECEQFRLRMRQEHPDWNAEQVEDALRANLTEQRRIDEVGIYRPCP